MVLAGNSGAFRLLEAAVRQRKSNYAINPTPELYLRSNRAPLPARVIATLGLRSCFEVVAVYLIVRTLLTDRGRKV